jgi:hypothetical protein
MTNDTQHDDIQYNDTQHYDIQHNNKLNAKLRITTLIIIAKCCYAECHKKTFTLSVIMLDVVMLSVGPPIIKLPVGFWFQ